MKNTVEITVRAFPVTVRDNRTGEKTEDTLVLTREQVMSALHVDMDSKELIHRLYRKQGYSVLEIGKAFKQTIPVDFYIHNEVIQAEGLADGPDTGEVSY